MPGYLQDLIDGMIQVTGPYLPRVGGAIAVLVIGWLLALLLARLVRTAVRITKLGDLIGGWLKRDGDAPPPVDRWIGSAVYYLVLLLVVVGAIQVLDVTIVTEPLTAFLTGIFGYLPQLIGAAILLLLAWLLATVMRFVVRQLLSSFHVDRKIGAQVGAEGTGPSIPFSQIVGDVVYWLVFLLFLPAILGALGIVGLLDPVQSMVGEILTFLPNVIAAGLILLVGWFVAKVVRRLVTNLLVSVGIDRFSERVGLAGTLGNQRLSGLAGLIVYALIFVPVILAALNALSLDALTGPTSDLLSTILLAIPTILAAAIVLILAYVVGKVVGEIVSSLLSGLGFDALPNRLGIGGLSSIGGNTPSDFVGYLVVAAFLVVAALGAASLLQFSFLAALLSQFLVFAGQIIFGLIVFAIGLLFASLAGRVIQASNVSLANVWALAARITILFLSGAIALRAMGFANEIVILAFALPLAAISVATAVAFGVGGREVAARELNGLVESIRGRSNGEGGSGSGSSSRSAG